MARGMKRESAASPFPSVLYYNTQLADGLNIVINESVIFNFSINTLQRPVTLLVFAIKI